MTTFNHPQTLWHRAILAPGQTTVSWRTVWSCLLSHSPCYSPLALALWLEESDEPTASLEGTHLWRINLEAMGGTLPNPDESGITVVASVELRQIWVLLVASLANFERLVWAYPTEGLGKISGVPFECRSHCKLLVLSVFLLLLLGLSMENGKKGKKTQKKSFLCFIHSCLHFVELSVRPTRPNI